MMLMSDVVIIDEHIVKNRFGDCTIKDDKQLHDILDKLDEYCIIFFNRDHKNGPRILHLSSTLYY